MESSPHRNREEQRRSREPSNSSSNNTPQHHRNELGAEEYEEEEGRGLESHSTYASTFHLGDTYNNIEAFDESEFQLASTVRSVNTSPHEGSLSTSRGHSHKNNTSSSSPGPSSPTNRGGSAGSSRGATKRSFSKNGSGMRQLRMALRNESKNPEEMEQLIRSTRSGRSTTTVKLMDTLEENNNVPSSSSISARQSIRTTYAHTKRRRPRLEIVSRKILYFQRAIRALQELSLSPEVHDVGRVLQYIGNHATENMCLYPLAMLKSFVAGAAATTRSSESSNKKGSSGSKKNLLLMIDKKPSQRFLSTTASSASPLVVFNGSSTTTTCMSLWDSCRGGGAASRQPSPEARSPLPEEAEEGAKKNSTQQQQQQKEPSPTIEVAVAEEKKQLVNIITAARSDHVGLLIGVLEQFHSSTPRPFVPFLDEAVCDQLLFLISKLLSVEFGEAQLRHRLHAMERFAAMLDVFPLAMEQLLDGCILHCPVPTTSSPASNTPPFEAVLEELLMVMATVASPSDLPSPSSPSSSFPTTCIQCCMRVATSIAVFASTSTVLWTKQLAATLASIAKRGLLLVTEGAEPGGGAGGENGGGIVIAANPLTDFSFAEKREAMFRKYHHRHHHQNRKRQRHSSHSVPRGLHHQRHSHQPSSILGCGLFLMQVLQQQHTSDGASGGKEEGAAANSDSHWVDVIQPSSALYGALLDIGLQQSTTSTTTTTAGGGDEMSSCVAFSLLCDFCSHVDQGGGDLYLREVVAAKLADVSNRIQSEQIRWIKMVAALNSSDAEEEEDVDQGQQMHRESAATLQHLLQFMLLLLGPFCHTDDASPAGASVSLPSPLKISKDPLVRSILENTRTTTITVNDNSSVSPSPPLQQQSTRLYNSQEEEKGLEGKIGTPFRSALFHLLEQLINYAMATTDQEPLEVDEERDGATLMESSQLLFSTRAVMGSFALLQPPAHQQPQQKQPSGVSFFSPDPLAFTVAALIRLIDCVVSLSTATQKTNEENKEEKSTGPCTFSELEVLMKATKWSTCHNNSFSSSVAAVTAMLRCMENMEGMSASSTTRVEKASLTPLFKVLRKNDVLASKASEEQCSSHVLTLSSFIDIAIHSIGTLTARRTAAAGLQEAEKIVAKLVEHLESICQLTDEGNVPAHAFGFKGTHAANLVALLPILVENDDAALTSSSSLLSAVLTLSRNLVVSTENGKKEKEGARRDFAQELFFSPTGGLLLRSSSHFFWRSLIHLLDRDTQHEESDGKEQAPTRLVLGELLDAIEKRASDMLPFTAEGKEERLLEELLATLQQRHADGKPVAAKNEALNGKAGTAATSESAAAKLQNQLEREKSEWRRQLEEANSDCAELQKEKQKLQDELAAIAKQKAHGDELLKEKQADIDELKAQHEEHVSEQEKKHAASSKPGQAAEEESAASRSEALLVAKDEELTALRQQLKRLDAEKSSQHEVALEKLRDTNNQMLAALRKQVSMQQEKLESREKSIASLSEKKDQVEKESTNLKDRLRRMQLETLQEYEAKERGTHRLEQSEDFLNDILLPHFKILSHHHHRNNNNNTNKGKLAAHSRGSSPEPAVQPQQPPFSEEALQELYQRIERSVENKLRAQNEQHNQDVDQLRRKLGELTPPPPAKHAWGLEEGEEGGNNNGSRRGSASFVPSPPPPQSKTSSAENSSSTSAAAAHNHHHYQDSTTRPHTAAAPAPLLGSSSRENSSARTSCNPPHFQRHHHHHHPGVSSASPSPAPHSNGRPPWRLSYNPKTASEAEEDSRQHSSGPSHGGGNEDRLAARVAMLKAEVASLQHKDRENAHIVFKLSNEVQLANASIQILVDFLYQEFDVSLHQIPGLQRVGGGSSSSSPTPPPPQVSRHQEESRNHHPAAAAAHRHSSRRRARPQSAAAVGSAPRSSSSRNPAGKGKRHPYQYL